MASRKTTSERIAEIEKKQEQMNALKKQLQKREAAENRKARTRRLIMIGAEVEKILGNPIEEKDLPRLISLDGFWRVRKPEDTIFLKRWRRTPCRNGTEERRRTFLSDPLPRKGALICGRSPHQ